MKSELQTGPTLGRKMAPPRSQILTVPQWFLLPSGSQIINCIYHFCNNYFFILLPSPTFFYWNSLSFIWGCSNGIQHISKESKSNCRKNSNYSNSFGYQGKEQITVELQDPFCNWAAAKMMEAMFTFAKIQSHLHHLLQLHQSNVHSWLQLH